MLTLLAALFVAASSPQAQAMPTDPFQRCATKALRGDYGHLSAWQRVGYQKALANGSQPRTFVITGYFPSEGRDGRIDRKGKPLFEGALACNRLPYGSFVFLPSWGRLFRVVDCGARSNDRRREVTRHGGTWADVWLRRASDAKGRCDWSPTRGLVVR